MKAILSINGTEPRIQPIIGGYSVTRSDLLSSGSGRSAEMGRALRYPIRRDLYKLSLKFKGAAEDISQVCELVSSFEQQVTFLDGTNNDGSAKYVTRTMYPGDRQLTANGCISELSVNLIEV